MNQGILSPSTQFATTPLPLLGEPRAIPTPRPLGSSQQLDWRLGGPQAWPDLRNSIARTTALRGGQVPDTVSIPSGTIDTGQIGCVLLQNGKVFTCPYTSNVAYIYDAVSNTHTATSVGTSLTVVGAVLMRDGRVFCVPYSATSAKIYDPNNNTWSSPAGTYSVVSYGGVLLSDGRVFCAVSTLGGKAPIYNPVSNTLSTTNATFAGGSLGAVLLPDGRVALMPYTATVIPVWDPRTDTVTNSPTLGATQAYYGGCLLPDGRVFVFPGSATTALIFDPTKNTLTTARGTYSNMTGGAGGVILPDGRLFIPPWLGTTAYLYDPITNTTKASAASWGGFYWEGVVTLDDGRVYVSNRGGTTQRIYGARGIPNLFEVAVRLGPHWNKGR